MGSIVNFIKNPNAWHIYLTDMRLKDTNEELMFIEYGSLNDYPEGDSPLTMYMRKSIYDNLVKEAYFVKYEVGSGHVRLYDRKTGDLVSPLNSSIY